MTPSPCHYCDLAAGRTPSPGGTIYENSLWHVAHIAPPKLQMRGMLVIRSKRHIELIPDLSDEETTSLGPIQRLICTAVKQVFSPARLYCICIGEGSPHLHFAVIPRLASMPAGSGVKTLLAMGELKYACSEAEAAEAAGAVRDAVQAILAQSSADSLRQLGGGRP